MRTNLKLVSQELSLRECIGYLYGIDINDDEAELALLQLNLTGSSIYKVEKPDPTELDIANREAIIQKLLLGEGVKMLLMDDIETTEEEFDELVQKGEITTETSDPDVIDVDGLFLSVNK